MDNNTLAIYMNELHNQAQQVKGSFDIFNQALESKASMGVLFALNSVMLNASQLSAILWPPRARARPRAEHLRKLLQITEKNPLNDRRLTEFWDRNDEKMDDWIASTKGEKVVFDYVGNFDQLGQSGINDAGIYRAYDPERKIYYYRGIGFNIETIANALMDVGGRITQVHQQMFPPQEPATADASNDSTAPIAAAPQATKDAEKIEEPIKPVKKQAAKKKAAPKGKAAPKEKAAPKGKAAAKTKK